MNYELAKQLKDAGFPQTRRDATIPSTDPRYDVEPLMFPTLEELIEACGTAFRSLTFHFSDKQWTALAAKQEMPQPRHRTGSTPTEAVARLWLALAAKEKMSWPNQN